MKTKDCFTELAIQISTLNMKLDAILKLLNTPAIEVDYCEDTNNQVKVIIDSLHFDENFK